VAMHALQGYHMDKNDSKGLHISYAKTDRRDRRRDTGAGSSPSAGDAGQGRGGVDLHGEINGRPIN